MAQLNASKFTIFLEYANFEAFRQVISSSINLLFLKSAHYYDGGVVLLEFFLESGTDLKLTNQSSFPIIQFRLKMSKICIFFTKSEKLNIISNFAVCGEKFLLFHLKTTFLEPTQIWKNNFRQQIMQTLNIIIIISIYSMVCCIS